MTRTARRLGVVALALVAVSSMTGCRSFARGFGQGVGYGLTHHHHEERVVVVERPRPATVVVVQRGHRRGW